MTPSAAAAAEHVRVGRNAVPAARDVPPLEEDVAAGLLSRPLELPPKYFYDDRGSRLFDRICETPEYYLTRAEDSLLRDCAAAVVEAAAPEDILEFGSGMSRKTRRLLDACESGARYPSYTAFDISEEALDRAASRLVADYDWLRVNLLVGDYDAGLAHLPAAAGPRLYCFLGSTIGNFPHARAVAFLAEIRGLMAPRDFLLLGADRVKDEGVLNAAYNDRDGLTAAFNLNLLHVLNAGVGADFDPGKFAHRAAFNRSESRVEMRLVSRADQTVRFGVLDAEIEVPRGDSILTEISRKFTVPALTALLGEAGFETVAHFAPSNEYFSLALARPNESGDRHA